MCRAFRESLLERGLKENLDIVLANKSVPKVTEMHPFMHVCIELFAFLVMQNYCFGGASVFINQEKISEK